MVTAIGQVERAPNISLADAWLDQATPEDDGLMLQPSELDRLLTRGSALDRIIADAGPLGKFRVDMDNALPSGTSALTVRTDDTLVRALSLVDFTGEDLLAATPQHAPPVTAVLPPADALDDPARNISARLHDPRPAIAGAPIFAGHPRPFATLDVQSG